MVSDSGANELFSWDPELVMMVLSYFLAKYEAPWIDQVMMVQLGD